MKIEKALNVNTEEQNQLQVKKYKKLPGGKLISNCVKPIANFILKHDNQLKNYIEFLLEISDEDFINRVKNTLIVCNHDLFILDFYCIPYILSTKGIEASIVVHDMFIRENGSIFNGMTEKYKVKLISKNGAVDNIIDHLKQGRTVVIFYDTIQYKLLEEKKSIPHIIKETGVKPIFMKYEYSYGFRRIIRGVPIVESLNYNVRSFLHFIYHVMKKKRVYLTVKISDKFDNYEQLIANKEFIKPPFLE